MTNPHVAALEQLAVYQLVYPGAVLLRQGALPPSTGMDGPSGATAIKVYGIPAPTPAGVTPQAILAWYHQHLQAQGWTFILASRLSAYSAQERWITDKYYAIIGIYERQLLRYYEPSIDPTKYPIAFAISLGER
jgi:hypothetical protein